MERQTQVNIWYFLLALLGVTYEGVIRSTFFRDVLSWIVPAVAFFAIWMFLVRRVSESQGLGDGFLSVGQSKARIYMEADTKVSFDDVAGEDEAKEELREVVGFLKDFRAGGGYPAGVAPYPGEGRRGTGAEGNPGRRRARAIAGCCSGEAGL